MVYRLWDDGVFAEGEGMKEATFSDVKAQINNG